MSFCVDCVAIGTAMPRGMMHVATTKAERRFRRVPPNTC